MSGNEASAIGSMRAINTSQQNYSQQCNGYSPSLTELRVAGNFCRPTHERQASVAKSGFTVTMVQASTGAAIPAPPAGCTGTTTNYYATARPLSLGSTGTRSFATNGGGHHLLRRARRRRRPTRFRPLRPRFSNVRSTSLSLSPAWPPKEVMPVSLFPSRTISCMKVLYGYLRSYARLVALALVLAAINQVFSLLDPLILRHVIDEYATRFQEYTTAQFFSGVSLLLGAAVGVAFVSRVAKNFQDYYINVITQRIGAQLYSDGIQHSLKLPYSVFEDQRSGETLGRLQKVRSDVEKLISTAINVLFTSLVGIIFVMVYAFSVHWLIAPVYFLTVPILGLLSSVLSRRIKQIQKVIVAETTALAGSTTESLRNIELVKSLGLQQQEIERLNGTTAKILRLELKKVRYLRSLSFIQGTAVNLLRTSIMFLMLYLIYTRAITVGQFFSLFIYSFFIFGPLQELGNIINIYRETEASLNVYEDILRIPEEPRPVNPVPVRDLRTLAFEHVTFQHQSASSPAVSDISFRLTRGETIAFVGTVGRRQDDARQAAGRALPPADGPYPLQRDAGNRHRPRRSARADRLRHAGHAAVLGNNSGKPALRQPGSLGRGVPQRAEEGGVRQPAGAGRTAASTRSSAKAA